MPEVQWTQEMLILAERFKDECKNLKTYLDELTMDGSGILSDLKQAVGGNDSDLGQAISGLGGKVMQAKSAIFDSLDNVYNTIIEKANDAQLSSDASTQEIQNITDGVSNITFEA